MCDVSQSSSFLKRFRLGVNWFGFIFYQLVVEILLINVDPKESLNFLLTIFG